MKTGGRLRSPGVEAAVSAGFPGEAGAEHTFSVLRPLCRCPVSSGREGQPGAWHM